MAFLPGRRILVSLAVFGLLGAGLSALAYYAGFLYFHFFAELFCVLVGFCIFMIGWNARRTLENGYLLLVAISFPFIGVLGILHTMTYKGMSFFPGVDNPDIPTQLWIAMRYMTALSLLAAPLFIHRRLNLAAAFAAYTAATTLILWSIFGSDVFPACLMPVGEGQFQLTAFKIVSEYVICTILFGSLLLLYRHRAHFDPAILRWVVLAIAAGIASELCFTLYTHPYAAINFSGHLLMLLSYYFFYKAIVETGIRKPYELLFHNLAASEKNLRMLNETLELRVAERAAVAEQRAHQLESLAAALADAEQQERRRLAQVLHDDTQQLLVAARMAAARLRHPSLEPSRNDALAHIDHLLQQALDSTRSLTMQLCPPILTEEGLAAALVWLAGEMHEKHALNVEIEADEGVELRARALSVPMYNAIRELLFNIVKHAGTDRARVFLSCTEEGEMKAVVEDGGRGFDVQAMNEDDTPATGFGLYSVQKRMELEGGSLRIESEPGEGTRVTILIPPKGKTAHAQRLVS